jgi:hypothetical protein
MQQDHIVVGLLAGIIFPLSMWMGLQWLSDFGTGGQFLGGTFVGLGETFIATMSVCANFIPFFVYVKTRKDNAMKGVGMVTMILALVVAFKYFLLP